jgi:RNA recognition motif-containing protein
MNIYVSNLSATTTTDDLKQVFLVYGTVKQVVIVSDERSGGHEAGRHGYVEMTSKAEATAAISSLNGTKIGGRVINAVEAPTKDAQPALVGAGTQEGNIANAAVILTCRPITKEG